MAKVICSDCGNKFECNVGDLCPSCNGVVTEIVSTAGTNDFSAVVETT